MKHISLNRAKAYSKIISRFISFSSSVDPDDLDKFIQTTFKLSK